MICDRSIEFLALTAFWSQSPPASRGYYSAKFGGIDGERRVFEPEREQDFSLERLVETNALLVRDDQKYEQDIRQLHGQILIGLVCPLRLVTEPVIHFSRELADFFDQTREVSERGPVSFLKL